MPYNSRKDRALDSDKRNIEMGAKKKKPPVIPEKLAANGRKRPPKAQERAAMSGGGGGGRGLGGGTARDPGENFRNNPPRTGRPVQPPVEDQMARNGRDYNIPKPTGNPGPIESPDWNPPQLSDPTAPEGRNPDGSPRGTVYNPRPKPTGAPGAPKLKWGQTAAPEGSVAPAGQRWSLNQGKYITPPVKPQVQVGPPLGGQTPEGKPIGPGQYVPALESSTQPYVNPMISNSLSGKGATPNMGSNHFGDGPGGNMLPPQMGGRPGGNMLGSPGAPGQSPIGGAGGQVNPIALGQNNPGGNDNYWTPDRMRGAQPATPGVGGMAGPQPGVPMGPGQSGAGGAGGGLGGPSGPPFMPGYPGQPPQLGFKPAPLPGQQPPNFGGGPGGNMAPPQFGGGPGGNMTPPWMQPPGGQGQPGQQINPIAFNDQPNPMSPFQTGGGSPQQNPQYWQQLMQLMQMQQGQGR